MVAGASPIEENDASRSKRPEDAQAVARHPRR
jgi:hypothetical protein